MDDIGELKADPALLESGVDYSFASYKGEKK